MAEGRHRRRRPWIVRRGIPLAAAALVAVGGTLGILEASESPTALSGRTTAPSSPSAPVTPSPSASFVITSPAASTPPSGPPDLYAAISDPRLSPAVAGFPERVYVPNTVSGTVSVIDPTTYKVIETLSVGGTPHHVTPSWDMRHLYVDNPGAASSRRSTRGPRPGRGPSTSGPPTTCTSLPTAPGLWWWRNTTS